MKNSFVRSALLLTILVAGASVPATAFAQGSDKPQVARTTTSPALAPTGASRSMAIAPVNIPPQSMQIENVGQDKARMGVGLAAIVVGILAGGEIGTLFMIAGGIIGLVGLYGYMR